MRRPQNKKALENHRGSKMSIQGVQPKLSTILNIKDKHFDIVDRGGRYIFKPQHQFFVQMPENEDLTMRFAALIDLDVPIHGMIWSKDHSLTYFIKRFDRKGQKDKIPVEDFAQLAGLSRDTKYNYILFCFLTGNEDMHLKNFSIINKIGKIELSLCYNLLNYSAPVWVSLIWNEKY